jgi:hypothetical protein
VIGCEASSIEQTKSVNKVNQGENKHGHDLSFRQRVVLFHRSCYRAFCPATYEWNIADWHLYIKHTKRAPDGTRLMFVFTNEIRYAEKYAELPRVKDIYVVNADGTGLRRVGSFGNHPIWHPNSQEILTNSPYEDRPNNSLVLTHVDSGERRLATACIAGSGHPSFAPDGHRLCVDHVLPREGYGSLNLVFIAGDGARDEVEHLVNVRVHDHSHVGTHLHPVWSGDGRQILYASDASGVSQLCVLSV